MSISGLFLILFLGVHLFANISALFGAGSFNRVCRFMGANPFILVMVPVLAAGVCIHIFYALRLTLYNLKARGAIRYAVRNRGRTLSWASKNMFVLGILILCGLLLHLYHFWAHMQLQEVLGRVACEPYDILVYTFNQPVVVVIYLIWIMALWFHLTHGFWSAFQTLGLNNQKWMKRWQTIAHIYAAIIAAGFVSIPVYIFFLAP